jgi:4-hydroxybenzoate polyprenyltransferase
METIKRLFLVARPISWLNTAYPFAAAYFVSSGHIDITWVIGTLYFLGPYNLLMYGINDIFDYESDIRNPRKGGIEGMREQRIFHPIILRAALVTNIPFIFYLIVSGGIVASLVLSILIFFVVAYSAKGLRFKEKPLLDSVSSSIHFVGPLIYALCLTSFTSASIPYIIAFFLWGMASHAFGAVQDIIPDRQAKLSSIATFFGAQNTIRFAWILYVIAIVIVAMQGFPYATIAIAGLIYPISITQYLVVSDEKSAVTHKGWRRFIWSNLLVGFVITIVLISVAIK